MKASLALPPLGVPPLATRASATSGKLGLSLPIALVVGSIVGIGIFGLPQNMASGAGVDAILIGWTITGVGMLMLARVFQVLALRRPDLDNGVYAYARALSGDFPEGSMGPKVEAASRFAQATGRRALIGALDHIEAMLKGEAGTQVRLDSQAP